MPVLGRIHPIKNKTGVENAVIYGVYAGVAALTGLIYAKIKIFGGQTPTDAAASATEAVPMTLGAKLKMMGRSIWDGLRIVIHDRLLRAMLALSMISALFEDPLVSNVLPDYVNNLAAKSPGTIAAILRMPGLGRALKAMMGTAMGNFALLIFMGSLGTIAAALLMPRLIRFFQKHGFKTEESLSIPFYFIAALEAPLFLLMIHTPTLLGVIGLYCLQALVIGFNGINIGGLYQRNMKSQKKEDVNKIYAANSLLTILVTIASTYAYGFLLKGISIADSMRIAAGVTGIVALVRLVAPFASFTKAQMFPPPAPPDQQPPAGPIQGPKPPALFRPSLGDHHGQYSAHTFHF